MLLLFFVSGIRLVRVKNKSRLKERKPPPAAAASGCWPERIEELGWMDGCVVAVVHFSFLAAKNRFSLPNAEYAPGVSLGKINKKTFLTKIFQVVAAPDN